MPSLSWKHHTLIQALITRGPLSQKDFHVVFSAVTGRNPGVHKKLFNEYLLAINRELSLCQFELRACRDQYDGHVCYGMVNNVADEQSKLGTKYSAPQIAFYKGIIEAITQDVTAQGSISNIDALNVRVENQVLGSMGSQSQDGAFNIPAAFRNFSMSQKEKTLEEFVQDKWLCHTPDGKIGLGVRSFLDLRSWFRGTDIPSCEACNEAVVKGEICQGEGCAVRIHRYCLKKKTSQKSFQGELQCPSCGTKWPNQITKVEAVKEEEVEPNGGTQSQPASGTSQSQPSSGAKRRRLRSDATDGVDSSSVGGSDTRRVTRSSARVK